MRLPHGLRRTVVLQLTICSNLLALPVDVRPPIQPRLENLHTHRQALSSVIAKLVRLRNKRFWAEPRSS